MIKVYIFFFTFSMNYVVSAMFYSDSTMHQIYIEEGLFNFIYQLPQMFYSFIISSFLENVLSFFGLYENKIIDMKNNKDNNANVNLKTKDNDNKLDLKQKENFSSLNDEELNSLDYEEARKKDKRTYCQYYISLIKTKHILIFTFCNNKNIYILLYIHYQLYCPCNVLFRWNNA